MPVRDRACLISKECSRHSRAFAEVTLVYREGHRSSLNRSAIYNRHAVCLKGAGGYVMRNKLLFFCMLLAAMAVLLVGVAAVSSASHSFRPGALHVSRVGGELAARDHPHIRDDAALSGPEHGTSRWTLRARRSAARRGSHAGPGFDPVRNRRLLLALRLARDG